MNNVILKIENIHKQYRLGLVGTGTLSHDLNRWWSKIRGKNDPYIQIGENQKSNIGNYFWALQDININVEKGEVIGIIGKNGAGKSTLLKVLSQVTNPTIGKIKVKGRIASLLEVGTGFHPELTGIENIYLNGAILGMTKKEVSSKLDEIIDFSGVRKYINTPVKRYSSGMKVRLGFAVAAHLEPEILIVDEVLAVGDAEFQSKCLGKMKDVSQNGRTVLFVSHNMSSVRNLCQKVILLDEGKIVFSGNVNEGINRYLNLNNNDLVKGEVSFNKIDQPVMVKSIKLINEEKAFNYSDSKFGFIYNLTFRNKVNNLLIGTVIEDFKGNVIMVSSSDENKDNLLLTSPEKKDLKLRVEFNGGILKPGTYFMGFFLKKENEEPFHKVSRAFCFDVYDNETYRGMKDLYRNVALVAPVFKYYID